MSDDARVLYDRREAEARARLAEAWRGVKRAVAPTTLLRRQHARHPWLSLAAAGGGGLLVGMALGGRRRPRRLTIATTATRRDGGLRRWLGTVSAMARLATAAVGAGRG